MIPLRAQELTFWQKVNNFLTKPDNVDTTKIYQPNKACFALGLFTLGQKASFDVDVNFSIKMDETETFNGISSFDLSETPCKKVGIGVSYGNIGVGYSHEIGPPSATNKRSFDFNIIGKAWGLGANFFKISNPFISGLTLWDNEDETLIQDEFTAKEMASLRSIAIDGYYVFNNKRFAYPAAYKMSLVQRHTAGSWMLTARYMQGDLYNSPEAAWDSYNLLDCFSTMQASIGGGYSVNFVLWHKDPIGPRDERLRNLTINLTAMPVLTVFNYLKTTAYEYDENSEYSGKEVSKVWCRPVPNYIGSAAVSLTMWRFYFSAQYTYNRFYFRSRDAFNASQMDIPDYVDDINFRGTFHDWMLKVMLYYRF